ncbi:MAG: phosphotransferase enzyme family protein [Planctomycetota bacterium]|jgi:Ser/Thr protein kinase RdoA (MazF antagonist)
MPRGGAHFSGEELAQVLSHYDVGVIHQARPLSAGSRRAPKVVIISEQGKFLLKRRPKGKDDLYRVAFAHAVQNHLAQRGFPVTALVATRDENNTILQLDNHIYTLFKFVTGVRYDGSAEATADAGRQLAKLHTHLADFASEWKPLRGSFHDSSMVRRHLKMAGAKKGARPDKKVQDAAEDLMTIYNSCSVRVSELGFDSWSEQVVHGDWHPGNMLFARRRLVAVLDFDSTKLAAPVTDLANGMLQFSIVGGRPNPADWPAYLDQAKLVQFFGGYQLVIKLDENQFDSLLDLMIETMIAEAILPVAATGFFGNLSGLDFLKMIQRKCRWIDKNRKALAEAVGA